MRDGKNWAGEPQSDLSRLLAKPIVLVLALLAILVMGLFNALPHVNEPIWQDEAVTLSFHASRGSVQPFLHYLSPNNHVAFTSLLAAWMSLFPEGLDVFTLRLLPLLLFLAAIPTLFFAALRIGGPLCAISAGAIFASSTVAGNFATQLRGYGPSWMFFSIMLLAAINIQFGRRRGFWQTVYLVSCLASVALLPTNFFFAAALSVSAAICVALSAPNGIRSQVRTCALLLAAPFLCLVVAYGAIWDELMTFSKIGFSDWSRTNLATHWLHGSLSNFIWIAPAAGAGLAVGIHQLARDRVKLADINSYGFIFSTLLILGFTAALLAFPKAPFPRTLVPFLPVWIVAVTYLIIHGIRIAGRGRLLPTFAASLLLFALPLPGELSSTSCKDAKGQGGAHDYDLCYQYFRDKYQPGKVLDAWAALNRSDIPIVTSFEGFYALDVLGSSAQVFEFTHFEPIGRPAPLLVAHDRSEFELIARKTGVDPASYGPYADTGYFKVFAPGRAR